MQNTALIKKYSEIICRVFDGEEILISTEFDLSDKGAYTDGFFAVSKDKICVIENGSIILVENIKSIDKVFCLEYNGSGILEADTFSGRKLLARFSMEYIEEFNAIADVINDIIAGDFVSVNETTFEKEKVCPHCGKPFIPNTSVCPECTDKFKMLKRLWKLALPYKWLYLALFILFWVSSAVTVISPVLSKYLINDVLTSPENRNTQTLLLIVGLMLLCTVVTFAVHIIKDIVSVKSSNLLVFDLRNFIYEKLQKMPLGYIEKKKTGDLVQRINNDTHRIQIFIQDIMIASVNEIILFVAIGIITFSLNVKMALLIFVPMPIVIFLINKIRYSIRNRYMKQWKKMDTLTNRLTEVLNGIKLVKVFGKENDEIERFKETADTVRNVTCRNEKYVYTVFPLIRFLMSFGSYFVLLYGGSQVLGNNMSLGELVQFSSYGSYLYSKLEWFGMLPRHFTMAMVSTQRVFEVLDEVIAEDSENKISTSSVKGDIDFQNVSFGYKSYRKVLRNISSHINKGEIIGLVGHSGAGKSTFINLVMKLYNPNNGKILLDGEDLSRYDESSFKEILGVVLQESYLFSGTILENIAYANPEASLEACIEASKKANAHDFIMSLPDAYNTYVGEKGHRLSGGERQRISIARAILSNPKILILDEATASVDTETETKIQSALENVTEGKTVIAIAHRLSTLKNADRLFVFENGRIAETGTHNELLKKDGIYAKLFKAQYEMTVKGMTIDGYKKEEHEIQQFREDVDYDKD